MHHEAGAQGAAHQALDRQKGSAAPSWPDPASESALHPDGASWLSLLTGSDTAQALVSGKMEAKRKTELNMKLEEEQMSSTLALAIFPLPNITLVLTHALEGLTLNMTLTLTLIALTHALEGPHRGAEQAGEASPTGGALSRLLLFPAHICPCCRARLRSWVQEAASPIDPPPPDPPRRWPGAITTTRSISLRPTSALRRLRRPTSSRKC